MSERIVIWHNPRCQKSREGLAHLRARGVEPEVYDYLRERPDRARIEDVLRKLGLEPRALLREKEAEYRTLGLADPAKSRDALVQALVDHPKLIQRPIVVRGDRAVLARPAEAADALL